MLGIDAFPARARAVERVRGMRIEHLWQLAVLALGFTVAVGASGFGSDGWWSVKMGELSVLTGRPAVDALLAHAPANPQAANQQWLGQVIIYLLYTGLGEPGTRVVAGLLMCLTFGLLMIAARVKGGSPRTAALGVLVATVLAGSSLTIRAQLLAYPLFALTYVLLCLRRRQPSLLYLLPPLFALWASLHGSFALGLLLVALHAAGDVFDALVARRKIEGFVRATFVRWLPVLPAAFAASCLNPLGLGIYAYLRAVTTHPAIRNLVTEWQPTTIREPLGLALVGSLVLLVVVMRTSRRRMATSEMLLLPVFGYLALDALRSVVWWGMILAPILAAHLATVSLPPWLAGRFSSPREGGGRAHWNLAMAILILAQAGSSTLWLPTLIDPMRTSRGASDRPSAAAVDLLARLPVGSHLYLAQPWTGYLAWRLWPTQQPMLDLRIEAHPATVWDDYLAVQLAQPNWESILDRYRVDYLVLDPSYQGRLVEAAAASGRWAALHRDQTAVVLGRQDSRAPAAAQRGAEHGPGPPSI
jgi:hypothetical protein